MRALLPLFPLLLLGGCKTAPTTPATPPTVAIVNRSGLAYIFGVVVFSSPSRADTLTTSTGADSVCVQMPAAGDALEVFYGVPLDTLDPRLQTALFQGSASAGWLLFFGRTATTGDTIEFNLSGVGHC